MSSTSANKDYYASSIGKSRRSSPGDSQGIPFFQTGQGGRPVLPSFSTAFPNLPFPGPSYSNAYTAPRSSPGRYDLNAQALYPTTQWPTGNTPPSIAQGFPSYDMTTTQGRYSPQPAYAYSSRNSPPLGPSPANPRQLPPLATPSSGGDRWQQPAAYGIPAVHGYTNATNPANIRSPTASYAPSYHPYTGDGQTNAYTYMTSHDTMSMNNPGQTLFDEPLDMRMQPRSTSPYGRSSHNAHMAASNYTTPPPISPTSPEEPTIKKKRKRADAAQLKVLNETYARTAFPSTEERHSLAKALDMSARSVQIWFQNKRQSMRQTNRQSSSTVSSSHQPYCLPSPQSERMMEESMSHGHVHASNYSTGQISVGESPYMQGPPGQDIPRSHTSSSHRRYRSPEEAESHKWSSRGGY